MLGGCTYGLMNAVKGERVYASLNSVPVKVTKAWEFRSAIIICIYRANERHASYSGDAIRIRHPFFSRNTGVGDEETDKRAYIFSSDAMVYPANSIGKTGCESIAAKEIPVFSVEEMKKKGFVDAHSQAVFYGMKNNRIVSLGYFSAEKMFGKYHTLNIDLTAAKTIVGRSGGNLLGTIFLPLTAVVDVIAGSVIVGGMAISCANDNCK
jgi:hypothetical protein